MKETKNARFRRVAEARVNKIIRMLRLLGNCSGTNTYAYDADAVEQIFTALQIELDQARKRFSENGRPGRNRFSLSQAPMPDTVSYWKCFLSKSLHHLKLQQSSTALYSMYTTSAPLQ